VTCDFCATAYEVDRVGLESLVARLSAAGS